MKAFRHLMKVYDVINYRACATAAMRESKNAKEVVKLIKEETDLKIEIIDGQEEALIIHDSHFLYNLNDQHNYLFVDVGGGSTEVSLISNGELVQSFSYKIGTVRMLLNKVNNEEYERLRVDLQNLKQEYQVSDIIGSGGNIIKLNTLSQVRKGRKLSLSVLEDLNNKLKSLSVEERIELYQMKADRADVITFAADIYIEVAKTIGAKYYIVPKTGLIDGIIHLLFENWMSKKKNKKFLLEDDAEVTQINNAKITSTGKDDEQDLSEN